MKIKLLAAACLALGASSSFAATTLACDTSSAVSRVNTCAPEAKLYIAGSSALGAALSTVVPADMFDTSVLPIVAVRDTGSTNGTTGANAVTAWYGMSKAALTGGTSKRLFVVYNNNNGSAAGVSQLLAKLDGSITEADVVTIGPVKGVAGVCTATSGSTTSVDCASHALTAADVAISDTSAPELYKLYASAKAKLTTLVNTPLALQGFGVAVNDNLYRALQVRNVAEGLLPSTCVAGDATAACQPSIRSADYASLVTKQGSIKTAAALLGDSADTTVLTLARRDDLSGTQASSNIFFADNSCGNNHDAKGKLIAGVLGGQLDIISTTDSTPALVVQSNVTTGTVKSALASTTGYAIGVLTLNTTPTAPGKFVKIDGVSPNFNADGTADANQRNAMISGNYPFAMTSFAVTQVKPAKTSVAVTNPAVIPALIAGMKDSSLHNLKGIGYLDGGSDATKESLVHRTNGNNCSPLIK